MRQGLGQGLRVEECCWVARDCCLVQQCLEEVSNVELSQDHLRDCARRGLDRVRGVLDGARRGLDHPSRCRMIQAGSVGKKETYGLGLQPMGPKHPPLQMLGVCGTPTHLERGSGWTTWHHQKAQPSFDGLSFWWDLERWERKRRAAQLLLQAAHHADHDSRHFPHAVREAQPMKKCAA